MAETKVEKAKRYLAEGRLRIERVSPSAAGERSYVLAEARGDSGELHRLGFDPRNGEWRCTCDANRLQRSHPDCSHLLALKLVVVVETGARQEAMV